MILSRDEMKNCPFCNSGDIRLDPDEQTNGIKVWVGWCGNCGCFGPTDLGWSGAVEMWNLRRPYAELEEENEKLLLALRDLEKLFENEIGELKNE